MTQKSVERPTGTPNNSVTENQGIMSWWLYQTFNGQPKREDEYFPHPVCSNAEHEFLCFLVAANLIFRRKEDTHSRIKPATVQSYDGKKKQVAHAIKKDKIIKRNFRSSNQLYTFGEDTYLVLDGPLAGTIANYHLGLRASGDGTIPIQAVRPLRNNDTSVLHRIESFQTSTSTSPEKKELLTLASELIVARGYIHAVIYMLEQLEIDANKQAIIENSAALSIIQENIGIAPPLMLKSLNSG